VVSNGMLSPLDDGVTVTVGEQGVAVGASR
jgi:hypothetical protein